MRPELFRALNVSVVKDGRLILDKFNMALLQSETVGILGTFDSGMTTLLDTISGKTILKSGLLFYDDIPFDSNSTYKPEMKIAQISKSSSLIRGLKLWESILVIRKHRRRKFVLNRSIIIRELEKCFKEFDLDFEPNQMTDSLTPIQLIMMDILRLYLLNINVVLINDFSIECSQQEYYELFSFINKLKQRGISFIITSYRISNLQMYSDRILFFTDGCIVKSVDNSGKVAESTINNVLSSIFPDNLEFSNQKTIKKEIVFQAENIEIGLEKPISFSLKKGEIVAFVDPFKTSIHNLSALLRMYDKKTSFLLNGKPIKKLGWNKNIIFIDFNTNDMIFSRLSIINNICFTSYSKHSVFGIIRRKLCKFISEEFNRWYGDDSLMRVPDTVDISPRDKIAIMLFRLRLTNPDVLFCVDPGIDTDYISRQMIHKELTDFAYENGIAICILVSNTDGVDNIADRYIVLSKDNIIEEVKNSNKIEADLTVNYKRNTGK